MCFDAACQAGQDRLFLLSIFIPPLFGVLAYLLIQRLNAPRRRAEWPETESDGEQQPERAAEGVYRAVSYTTWPAEPGVEGQRLRIEVGPVGERVRQTFVFDRTLPRSEVLAVTLPRPMGVVFEESRGGRVVVGGLLEGSVAHQRSQVAKLDAGRRGQAALPGDILRACTCTNFVYETTALIGARPPRRTIVLFGADDRRWPQVINALKRGDPSDGPVTLVLERELPLL